MATQEQFLEAARRAKAAGNDAEAAALLRLMESQAEPEVEPAGVGMGEAFLRGMRDPIDAAAQLLERSVPESVRAAINTANQWLIEQGVPLEPLPEGGLSEQLQQQEQAYQAARGDEGFDWTRLGGAILSPANLMMASRIPQAATTGGRVLAGLGGGAAMGPLQAPVYGEDFWGEKAEQAALGGVGGAAVPAITGAVSSAIAPRVTQAAQALEQAGVRLTPGQKLGGFAKELEDKATSIPGLGHAIQRMRSQGYDDFNRSTINASLSKVGKSLPQNVETGHRASAYLQSELSQSYDALLEDMTGQVDDILQREVATVFDLAKTLPDDIQKYLSGVVNREINQRITEAGRMSGRSLKDIQSALTNEIASIKNPTGWDIKRKEALMEIREAFMRMVERQNPAKSQRLKDINSAWRDFEVITRAGSSVGAEGGVFTPAQLVSASKALDRSKNKRAFAQGRATLQPFAEAAKQTMPSKVPDSGTAGRMMVSSPVAGIMSSVMGAPFLPLYTPMGARAATARPPGADPIADLIRRASPYLVPGGAIGAQSAFGPAP